MLLLFSCTSGTPRDPSQPADTTADTAADAAADTALDTAPDSGFEPLQFLLMQASAAIADGTSHGYWLDGVWVEPTLELAFFNENYILSHDSSGTCTWSAALSLVEGAAVGTTWRSYAVTLSDAQTDCADFPEADWPGGDPTTVLTQAPMMMHIEELNDSTSSELYAQLDDYHGYVYTLYLDLEQGNALLGYGLLLEQDASTEEVVLTQAGEVTLLPVSATMADGVLRWLGYRSISASALLGAEAEKVE